MPQYNKETEAALIGTCLKNTKAFDNAKDIIVPEDFYDNGYGSAWGAMLDISSRGLGVDTITLGDEMERGNKLQDFATPTRQFFGRPALSWVRDIGEPRNISAYVAEVKDYSAKRQLELICTQAVNWSQNGRRSVEIMNDLTRRMDDIKIYDALTVKHTQTLAEAVSDAYDHSERARKGEIVTVSTGFLDLDYMLGGGLMAPDFMIVAGRPGSGKTALMVSIAKKVSDMQRRVAVFSLEMLNKQIAMRLLAMESGVNYGKQKSGRFHDEDWGPYIKAVETLTSGEHGIILNDLPAITPSQIRRELRRIWADKPCDLVIVDYIQLAGADGEHERRDLMIGEITAGIKSICKEFSVPVIAGAQMSREVEKRSSNKPQLSDLRESGSLENDSDVVAFLHKPDPENKSQVELILAKNRNGPVGAIDLYYKQELTKFESATSRIESFGNGRERKDID